MKTDGREGAETQTTDIHNDTQQSESKKPEREGRTGERAFTSLEEREKEGRIVR